MCGVRHSIQNLIEPLKFISLLFLAPAYFLWIPNLHVAHPNIFYNSTPTLHRLRNPRAAKPLVTTDPSLSKAIVGGRLQLASRVSTVNSTDVALQVEDLTELKEFIAPKHNGFRVPQAQEVETELYVPMRPPIDWMNWERIGEQLIDMFGYSKQEVMAYSDELENDKSALLKLYKSIVMGE